MAAQHNGQREQRRFEELQRKIEQVITCCHENDTALSGRYIVEQAGISIGLIQYRYPELWSMIRGAVAADQENRKMRQRVQQCQQINEAAERLAGQGIR